MSSDKFIGDAVMAFWGAPAMNPDHAIDCCRAALACLRAIEDFTAAIRGFEKAQDLRKLDHASSVMIELCKQQTDAPTDEDWDGTMVARTKQGASRFT